MALENKQLVPAAENALAEGILNESEILAAYLQASGMFTGAEIAEKLNRSRQWFYNLKSNPGKGVTFKNVIKEASHEVAERVLSSTTDIEEMFNNEIIPSVQTMREIRDDPFESGKVRLSAALAFVDRAPRSPKIRRELDVEKKIINIPIRQMDTIQEALEDIEDQEILKLLEGVDYETVLETSEEPETIEIKEIE